MNQENEPKCLCPSGYTGKYCEKREPTLPPYKPDCPLKCLNGGTCVLQDGKPKCNCLPRTMGTVCEVTCALFSCSHGGICVIRDGRFSCICRRGFRYVENATCVVDKCYEENRDSKLCGDFECVVTNDTNEATCRCPDGTLAKSCKTSVVQRRTDSEVTPQIIVPLVMALLLLIAVVLVFYCRRRCPANKAPYRGMNMQEGAPSMLYEEMLDDYGDSCTNLNFRGSHDGKSSTFSNPVYESLYRSDASLDSSVLISGEIPRIEYRKSKTDYSNPVYEALLMRNGSTRKSEAMFWGSSEELDGNLAESDETQF